MNNTDPKRQDIIRRLFPGGIPRLWCPTLTHFRDGGVIDFDRMAIHLRHITPWVKGYLIPGSTGDGWDLNDEETMRLTAFALKAAKQHGISLLLGALRTNTDAVRKMILDMMHLIRQEGASGEDNINVLASAGVCGFAVCPPKGKSLSPSEIEAGLSDILEMGLPIALYQLPQVTENEATPEIFARLAHRYPNLIFFKDSSGYDRIAKSEADTSGVFLVRGAEGHYDRWLKESDGTYDGFLLSTANCFAPELSALIGYLEGHDREKAADISTRITSTLREVFRLVKSLPTGSPFANAIKAIDHFYAFGPAADRNRGPMLQAGIPIPGDIIAATGAVLSQNGLMPEKGYLMADP